MLPTPPAQNRKLKLLTKFIDCLLYSADADLSWSRSFSEPDLATSSQKGSNRFTIKHPHEFIAVDDLKFYRRRQPKQLHTQSSICLYNSEEALLSFASLKSEYRKHYRCHGHGLSSPRRRTLLRRATSLRLEGLMQLLSEHQDKYHWYTPEDLQFSRTFPVRNPENLPVGREPSANGVSDMKSSSYLSYPMVDASTQILPRQMFRDEPELGMANKLAADKFKRDVAAQEQQKCHLQMRAQGTQYEVTPSEYKRQFVEQFPIEKAHSIPQMSSIKLQGEFVAVPEYQDSFKMYANYSKSAPIKKHDNLRVSGAEQESSEATNGAGGRDVPEYREKYTDPPKNLAKEKSLKTDDNLRPRGEFTKQPPEYKESFLDPVTQMPERGKVREPYLRLRGKIEFNPEYRNNYQDFPRARPVLRKPVSCFRLPNSNNISTTTSNSIHANSSSPCNEPTDKELTATPEYRRAQYNYQLRERERPRDLVAPAVNNCQAPRKSSDSSLEIHAQQTKRRPSRQRLLKDQPKLLPSFEDVGTAGKKQTRYGRRASVLQHASNCRENSYIIEGNPKYALGYRRAKGQAQPQPQPTEHPQGSFLVLDEPCKPSNWMKKTWYDS
ncbi:CG6362 [Drosophila busckii]|uniref:CG6362 n=1 Tax=Drosophila busckii TaxID=30019 RepID=A0A0M4EI24_DROBS|nr:CG6362 [Drosophila busckii]